MASANEIDTSNDIDINFVPIISGNTESGDKSRTPCQDISRLNKQYEQKCEGSNMTKGTSFSSDSEFPPILNRSKKSTYSRRKIWKTELLDENDAQPNDSSVCQLVDIENIILSLQNTTELPDSTLNDNSQESVENVSRIRVSTNLFDTESFEPSVQTSAPTSVPYSSEFIKVEIDPLDLNNIDLSDQAAPKAVLPRKGNNNYELNELLDQQVVGNISYTNTNCIESENSAIPMQLIRHIPGTVIRRTRNAPYKYVPKEPKFYLPRVVVCDICDLDFIGKSLLNTHLRFVHRPWALEIVNEVYCPQCKAWFDDEFKFKVHFPCFKKAVRIHCPLCHMENPMLEHYDFHNVTYRSGNHLWCKLCDSHTRYTVAELNEHRQTEHKQNGVFECLECKETFASYGEIKVHSQQHDTENTVQRAVEYKLQLKEECKETFKCEICDREFKLHRSLVYHRRSHDKALCSVCGLSFKSNSLLLEHQNIHFNTQTYTCEECGKEFNQRKYLTQHLRIHKVKKMFECEICNITFTQQTSLIYHMATHTNEDIFKCTLCNIKFDKQSKLSSHMLIHNADGTNPNQCQICKKYFAHNCNLIVHMRMHPEWKKEDSVKAISTSEQEKENKKDKVNKKGKVTVKKQKASKKSKAKNKK